MHHIQFVPVLSKKELHWHFLYRPTIAIISKMSYLTLLIVLIICVSISIGESQGGLSETKHKCLSLF